jgi:hypothetical protein
MRQRQTKLIYPNHRPSPWLIEAAATTRDAQAWGYIPNHASFKAASATVRA